MTIALTTGVTTPAAEARAPSRLALIVVLTGTFITVLDYFIATVAVPAIQSGLSAGATTGQLVVVGYGVTFSAGLILAGRIGDLYGRRRLFLLGMSLFALASAGCGLSPNATVLVVARIVQGAGAALLVPQVLGLIGTLYHGAGRARAFTAYGLVIGLAGVLGQVVGGALITLDVGGLGWRLIFLVNVPVCAVALALVRVLPESRAESRGRLDLRGALLVGAALGLLIYGLVQGRAQGWPVSVRLCLGAAVVLAAITVAHLRARAGRDPLIEPALFGSRTFSLGLAATFAYFLAMGSFFVILAYWLQRGRGLSALESGLVFMALGAGYFACSLVVARRPAPTARRVAFGPVAVAAGYGLAGLVAVRLDAASIWWLVLPLMVAGVGMGLATGPLSGLVMAAAPAEWAASASGLLNTAQEGGATIGVAIAGLVFYPAASGGDYAVAFARTLVPLVAFCLVAAVLTACSSGRGRATRST